MPRRKEPLRYRRKDTNEVLDVYRWEGSKRELPTVFRAHISNRKLRGGNIVLSKDESYWVVQVGNYTWGLSKGHWLIKHIDGKLEVMSHGQFERSFEPYVIDDAQ